MKSVSSAVLLKKHLESRQRKNPAFSLRSLAAKLEISPSYLSKVLSGKKPIPFGRISAIVKALELDSYARRALERAVIRDQNKISDTGGLDLDLESPALPPLPSEDLDISTDFYLLEDWYYLPILELVGCQGFSPSNISTRLGLKEEVARFAWKRLVSAGAVIEKNGKWEKVNRRLRLPSRDTEQRITNHHIRMLRKGSEELQKRNSTDLHARLVTGASITTNEKSFQKAKKYLEEALIKAGEILNEGEADDVYYLAFQLFPLSRK